MQPALKREHFQGFRGPLTTRFMAVACIEARQ